MVRAARRRAITVVVAGRRKHFPEDHWIPFELNSPAPVLLPQDADCIVHLAAETADCTSDTDCEVRAAEMLLSAAHQVDAKFVFISSQAARSDAPTAYGRTKWKIEQVVLAAGGSVIRPGLVYGAQELGLFGRLVALVRRFLVIPMFIPAPKIQPIHVDDLAEAIIRLVLQADVTPEVFCLGSPSPVTFRCFLSAIASHRLRRLRVPIPIPTVVVKVLLKLRFTNQFGPDRLKSLFELPPMATSSALARLGISLRSLNAGMHPSGDDRRRRLIQEAMALLKYVTKECPHFGTIARYVRTIEAMRNRDAMTIPQWMLKMPILLALLDRRRSGTAVQTEFAWRLDAATMLAEATPSGARVFLGLDRPSGSVVSAISIVAALTLELGWRALGIVASPYIRHVLNRSEPVR